MAKELGGSTAVVTNYLGTREEVLINAIRFAQEGWHRDAEAHLAGREGADRVRALAAWSCTTIEHDHAVRQLWLGLTGQYGRDSAALAVLREDAVGHRQALLEALEDAEVAFAEAGADALYLALRGFYFVSVEDPVGWTDERAERAVARLAELLLGAGDDPAARTKA